MGQLPEQRDTNIKILEQLQNQNQKIGESLRAAQDRKLFIQKQMTDMEMPVASATSRQQNIVAKRTFRFHSHCGNRRHL